MNFSEGIHLECKARVPDQADETIKGCISLENPKSFFLFAGAGSGKTGSLVAALNFARENLGKRLAHEKRKIGVITYTNAAADEINRRSEQYSCFAISTIHSFAWELIKPFQRDIKIWLIQKLEEDIAELRRKNGKNTAVELEQKVARLTKVKELNKFSYSPTGANSERDSLNHSEVISLCADFLKRPLMQEIFISQYPILFIDESQDTNKNLMDVFLEIQQKYSSRFMLGLFGDMMQRIYLDGKEYLDEFIGHDWARPSKTINYRSPKRIVTLVNTVRNTVAVHQQQACEGASEGIVRVFITQATADKRIFEEKTCQYMVEATGDPSWNGPEKDVKTLTLEHKMAAVRLDFEQLYNALDHSKKLRGQAFEKLTALDPRPQLQEIAFLTEVLLPLIQAHQENNPFGIMHILKQHSPILQPNKSSKMSDTETEYNHVKKAKQAAEKLFSSWENGADPDLKSVLLSLQSTNLLKIPDKLRQGIVLNAEATVSSDFVGAIDKDDANEADGKDPEERKKQQEAWAAFVGIPFSQIFLFHQYIKGESTFDTHQGVKGLEFPRVMVILDDEAAGGFLFSYDKLFGAKELSKKDVENINIKKDNSLTRTNRLFYVICSRARQSLAIVIYSANPEKVSETLLGKNIFTKDEVIINLSSTK